MAEQTQPHPSGNSVSKLLDITIKARRQVQMCAKETHVESP